jgi:Calx-beta domain
MTRRRIVLAMAALWGCGDNARFVDSSLVVAAAPDLRTSESGGSAMIAVSLSGPPASDVAVTVTSENPAEGSASPDMFVLTANNWDSPVNVTITGVNDDVADGDQPYVVQVDAGDAGLVAVSVTNADDDSTGILVSPTTGLMTTEGGATASFTVVLASQPLADVTVAVSSSDLTEGTVDHDQLVFTALNWNAPQTVMVTGVDDPLDDGDQTYTIALAPATSDDPTYDGIDPTDVTVTNVDDEAPGFVVTPMSGLITSEAGASDSFTVVLISAPTAPVTVQVSSSDPGEGTPFPTSLTFTPADWFMPQTVTVTGVDDAIADGPQLYHILLEPAVSTDPAYDGFDPPDVSVTNTDNDSPGITVTPTSGLLVSELGDTATFTIVLNSEPTADVTIPLSSSDLTEGRVSPASVTLTATDWFMPHTVTVTGVDDSIADGNQVFAIITGNASSVDPRYNGLNAPNVQVTNLDNDTASVIVDADPLLQVSEDGTTATFTMVLTTAPTANVTCGLASSDTTEGTVSPAAVVFTPANWFMPHTVTITGVDDTIVDGPQLFLIITAPCSSADPAYNGSNPRDVSARNLDND